MHTKTGLASQVCFQLPSPLKALSINKNTRILNAVFTREEEKEHWSAQVLFVPPWKQEPERGRREKAEEGRAVPFDSFFGSIVCEVASFVPLSRRGRKNGRLMPVICVVRFFHGENSSKVPIIQRKSGNYLRWWWLDDFKRKGILVSAKCWKWQWLMSVIVKERNSCPLR